MVDILMATYNGSKYIEEQIQSIIRQTHTDWRLLIHDDGSNDETVNIINKYSFIDNRIKLIADNKIGLGPAKNFMYLLQFSQSDFMMFCDQDDIWLENKIEVMLNSILNKDNHIAQAIFSNSYIWNELQGIVSDKSTLTFPRKLESFLFLNCGIQGAAGIFNAKTREILGIPLDYYAMHDHVLVLTAIIFGEVEYIDKSLMYYRQHNNNVTGETRGRAWDKFTTAKKNGNIPVVCSEHYKGVLAFYNAHKNMMSERNKQIMEAFLEMPNESYFKRAYHIIKYRFRIFDSTILLLLKMSLRTFYQH